MTDQQFLGVTALATAPEIKKALIENISSLDFEIDIENIFNYIHCSQRLLLQTNSKTDDESLNELNDYIPDYNTAYYESPEELIQRFTNLYDNPAIRFNKLLWKEVIEPLKRYHSEKPEDFLKPIADFLVGRPFLKTEVLELLSDTLPFDTFFNSEKNKNSAEFWQHYYYVYNVLTDGNLTFDLLADEINTGEFTSAQLDGWYWRLINSSTYFQKNNLFQAYSSLSDGVSDDEKPLLVRQREINILYAAAFRNKAENVSELFFSTIEKALTAFPFNGELLYMKAKALSHVYEPQKLKSEIINILRIIPDHEKCLFLLGKCYLKQRIYRAALVIFENLKKINPLNMQYVPAAAMASRGYIDFCARESSSEAFNKMYYIRMIQTLIEKEMFDEVASFATGTAQEDNDIVALLMYAKDAAAYSVEGFKNKEQLQKALSLTSDKEITRNIKQYYLRDLQNWSDFKEERDFIFAYYKENPEDSDANYQRGMVHYAEGDYEQAYEYLLKAKEYDPDNIRNYYNLARIASLVRLDTEALEYITIYLYYNKYNLNANEIYCDCTYNLRQYYKAHLGAKWLLSLCRKDQFDSKYFFYFTTSLYYHLEQTEENGYSKYYIREMLDLYDHYPKPVTFWTNDNGSRSMYWAAKLCYKIGDYQRGAAYLHCILEQVKEYNWDLIEKCKFQLLPECLHRLEQHEKLIVLLEKSTEEVLQKRPFDPTVRLSCFYLSCSYAGLEKNEERMKWAWYTIKCFLNMERPDSNWIEENLLYNFSLALDLDSKDYITSFGKMYLKISQTPRTDHVWLTHNLADFYSREGKREEALQYHRMCLDYALLFDEYPDETNKSREYVDSLN
jgi:hypothetical protein